MDLKIRAGMRVLYKHNGQWEIGEIAAGTAAVTKKGLFLNITPREFIGKDEVPYVHDAEINDIYFDAFKLEDWLSEYPEYYMTKEAYIKYVEAEDFDKRLEKAFVSDGEYGYYPVSKYARAWLEKQPFDYIVRGT